MAETVTFESMSTGSGVGLHHVGGVPLGELPLERVETELTSLSGMLAAATCRWLLVLGEFDRRDGFGVWGCTSAAQWLSWKCALDPVTANGHVRVARALPGLPVVREAFGRGELSYSKVRAIVRVATPANEQQLVDLARHATAVQVEEVVRGIRLVRANEAGGNGADLSTWRLDERWNDDGSWRCSARLAGDDGKLVREALRLAGERFRAEHPPVDGGPRLTQAEQAAQALIAIAEHYLGSPPANPSGSADAAGVRSMLLVHVDVDVLHDHDDTGSPASPSPSPEPCATLAATGSVEHPRDQPSKASGLRSTGSGHRGVVGRRAHLDDGPAISSLVARRLACDCTVSRIVTDPAGMPLEVGRATRTISPAIWRALWARDDGRCQFPGCGRRARLQAHHIEHWADGGPTDLANLSLACRVHHRLVHEGGWTLMRNPDGPPGTVVYCRPDRRPARIEPLPVSDTSAIERLVQGLDIGPDTITGFWDGSRLDLRDAVEILVLNDTIPGPWHPDPSAATDPAGSRRN